MYKRPKMKHLWCVQGKQGQWDWNGMRREVGGSGPRGITGPDLGQPLHSLASTLYFTLSKRGCQWKVWVEGVLIRWLGGDYKLWQRQGRTQGHQLEGYSQSSRPEMVVAWTKKAAVRGEQ